MRHLERRLTTILSADVGDLARREDSDRLLLEIGERHAAVVEPLLKRAGGRLVNVGGSGFLAEFGSVVNAVTFAVDLQQAMEERNAARGEHLGVRYRIGINLWDMVVSENDVVGDGVNVAVRLHGLAEPGGIRISETVHQHVHRQLPLVYEEAGSHQLKESPGLIATYRVRAQRYDQRRLATGAFQSSIAVLPFANLSGDPEQNYFSDGFTEGVSARLSKISALFVVYRGLDFITRGASESLSELAVKLGVQYLLQGSVRRTDDEVLVTAQLVDGHVNKPVWSRRYDCSFAGVFDVQDSISRDIVDALRLKSLPEERATLNQRVTHDSEAYRFYLMGRSYFHRGHTRRFLRLAWQMFQRAVDIEPDYAAAHAGIADCCAHLLEAGDFSVSVDEIFLHSERALSLDASLAEAHASRGLALYTIGKYEDAGECFEQAITLQPDLFDAYYFYGRNCFNLGQFSRAADFFGQAAKLRKDDFRSLGMQSMCYESMAQLGEARTAARSALARTEAAVAQRSDEADALSFGAGLLAFLGEYKRTRDWAERASMIEPDDFYINYNVACALAILGAKEEALDRLERIMQPPTPRSQHEHMVHDSDLDGLREHPRYLKLLKRLGL